MQNDCLQDFKKILIPLDGSRFSENALRYGVSIADKYNASIVLVSVFSSRDDPKSKFRKRMKEMNLQLAKDKDKMPSMYSMMYWMENYHGILKEVICNRKINVKSILRDANTSTKQVVTILLDVIEKEKIDLVIISSHGKSGFKKFKMGVTDGLLNALAIPVICVKK